MDYETVALDDENDALVIIDQTKLPGTTQIISLKTAQEIWDAIYLLKVRGAPAIGVAAAFGIYLLSRQIVTNISFGFSNACTQPLRQCAAVISANTAPAARHRSSGFNAI